MFLSMDILASDLAQFDPSVHIADADASRGIRYVTPRGIAYARRSVCPVRHTRKPACALHVAGSEGDERAMHRQSR